MTTPDPSSRSPAAFAAQYEADEFGFLEQRAAEHGIPWPGRPTVERVSVTTDGGRRISAIHWGSSDPEIVLLHGGAQNAHTFDAVALALGRPLVAIDLPGHGRSDWRDDHDYRPSAIVAEVAEAIETLAPNANVVCGMSLGGMTAIALAHTRPDLVRRLVVVDVAPSSGRERSGAIFDFIAGPEEFASLDEILERTMRFAPNRSRASLTVGVLHNAHAQPDGKWRWRYDPTIGSGLKVADVAEAMARMWEAIGSIKVPTLLVKGANSPSVSDDAIEEWRRRQPHVRVVVVPDAGHSVQSDQPLVLAQLLAELSDLDTT